LVFWKRHDASNKNFISKAGGNVMTLGTVLLVVLVLLLLGVIPTWPHSRAWGYGPSGLLGVILIVVLILFLLGRI